MLKMGSRKTMEAATSGASALERFMDMLGEFRLLACMDRLGVF
jgi:hypothetical protein